MKPQTTPNTQLLSLLEGSSLLPNDSCEPTIFAVCLEVYVGDTGIRGLSTRRFRRHPIGLRGLWDSPSFGQFHPQSGVLVSLRMFLGIHDIKTSLSYKCCNMDARIFFDLYTEMKALAIGITNRFCHVSPMPPAQRLGIMGPCQCR